MEIALTKEAVGRRILEFRKQPASLNSTGLTLYDKAVTAIAEALSVDEVNRIRDRHEAMRAAAKVAKNKQAEIDLAEIRFRAERKLGELMAAQREAGLMAEGHRFTGGLQENPPAPITLAEAGMLKVGNPNGFQENPLEEKPITLSEAGKVGSWRRSTLRPKGKFAYWSDAERGYANWQSLRNAQRW